MNNVIKLYKYMYILSNGIENTKFWKAVTWKAKEEMWS
jgi:hypothetical protein